MIESAAITLTTAPVVVSTTQFDPNGDGITAHTVTVQVPQTEGAVVVGGYGVTEATGLVVAPGQVITADLGRNEYLYARAVTGTSDVRVMRHGVNA